MTGSTIGPRARRGGQPFAGDDRVAAAASLGAQQVSSAAAARMRTLVDGLAAVMWEADARSGEWTFVSERVVEVLGYPVAAWLGRRDLWSSVLHPDDRDRVQAQARQGAASGRDYEQTHRMIAADGRTVWVHAIVHVRCDDAGDADTLQGVLLNITAQERAELAAHLLASASELLAAPDGLADGLEAVLMRAATALGDLAVVSLRTPDGRFRPIAAASPDHPDRAAALRALPPHQIPAQMAEHYRTGEAFVVPAVSDDVLREVSADDADLAARRRLRGRTTLVVPLIVGGRLLGSLTFVSVEQPRIHDAEDLSLAQELGRRIAAVADSERMAAEQRRLHRTTVALAAADTVAEVTAALLAGLVDVLDGETISVHVPESGRLRMVSAVGYSAELAEQVAVFPLDYSAPVTDCVRSGEPVWLRDRAEWAARYPHLLGALDSTGNQSAAAVPMRLGARIVAAVGLTFSGSRDFSGSTAAFLSAIVAQAAQAFDRATAADRRREVADTLQHALLPDALPALGHLALATRYLPAVHDVAAGGDWYDVIALDPHRTAVVVGDVVGQGAAAAAIMGQLRSALAAALLHGDGPAEALAHLDLFTSRVPGARASSAVCAVLDTRAGHLRWACAGHPPPLLLDNAGARYLDHAGRGPLLGCLSAMITEPGRPQPVGGVVALEPGATVLLYTDGLVERRGESIDTGLDRVVVAAAGLADVAPEPLLDRLLAASLSGGDNHDDVAVLAVRVLPAPLQRRVPARAEELPATRRDVQRWAEVAALGEDQTRDLQLALGEATANAVEHAYRDGSAGEVQLSLTRRPDGAVEVEVRDLGTWRPPPEDRGYRGRGLGLIHALAQDVTVDHATAGTIVRFTVPGS